MTSIRVRAFENCSSLKSVRFLGGAPDVNENIYYGTLRSLVTYVPKESVGWAGGASGTLPDAWPVGDATARAIAYWDGPDETVTATPKIVPGDGTVFEGACVVMLSCATEGATIYYTKDGSTPRLVPANAYTEPFPVDDNVTIKAIAVSDGRTQSASAVARLTKVDALTLALATGAAEGEVATDSVAAWMPVVDAYAPKGGMAAKSGAIGDNSESWMETSVVGPGTFSFWWRVSCVKDTDGSATWDRLVCEADGKEIGRIDGVTEWIREEIEFKAAGLHKVRWAYVKDGYDDTGDFEDCAWVQGLEWTPKTVDYALDALYTRDQMHALALGSLVIDVDPVTGLARIGLRLMETSNLSKPEWKPVSLTTGDLDIGADGTVGLNIPMDGGAGFFKVITDE